MLKHTLRIILLLVSFSYIHIAQASSTTAVQDVYYAWCSAISTAKGNPASVVKFYAPDAILLPTLSPKILLNRDGGLNAYFAKLTSLPHIRCKPEKLMTRVYGDFAFNTGLYAFSYTEKNGKIKTLAARFTFVYKASDKNWLIIEHHSSVLPEEK